MIKRIGVVAVFLVGCAVGGGAGQFAVPRASAQQTETLHSWENTCWSGDSRQTNVAAANFGAASWELVSMAYGPGDERTLCFKRPHWGDQRRF